MASGFDREKNKAIFEKRFGAGSYNAGLSQAREIGTTRARADFEKAAYNQRVKAFEAEMKEQKKAREKDAKKKKEKKEEYDILEEAKKLKEEKKDNSFLNKNVLKPAKNFITDSLKPQTKEEKAKSIKAGERFMDDREGSGFGIMGTGTTPKKKKEDDGNFLSDMWNVAKRSAKAANPFDDVSFGDAMLKNAMEFDKEKSKQFDSVDRFSGRAANSASLGIMGNIDKKMRDGETPDYLTKRKIGEGGGADLLADSVGYLIPGVGLARGLRGTKLGADLGKKALSKGGALTRAKEGAVIGGIMGSAEVGGRELFNPDDTNWKQNLPQIGVETAGGAILDPLLSAGGSKLLSKLKKKELLGLPEPKLGLPAPKQLELPSPIEKAQPKSFDELVPRVNEVAATSTLPNGEISGRELDDLFNNIPSKRKPSAIGENGMPKNPYESISSEPVQKISSEPITRTADGKKIKVDRNQKFKDTAERAIANSDLWKDKSPLRYGRETLERNLEDIASKEDAQFLKDTYVQPVRQKEAERIRFVNDFRGQVKNFGIKPRSKVDQLTQMYGEGKINLDNLKRETPNWKQVVKTANWYRNTYDQLITTVNKVLDDAGEKMIPIRADYFPHYQEVEGIFATLKKAGFNVENNTLPTDINGLTQNYKPNKKWFGNAMQRTSDETTFGAIAGFDKYIEGVSQLIYHTDNIKNLRALENGLRSKHEGTTQLTNLAPYLQEQGNLMAGKKAAIDRVIEEKVGRGVYNALDTIKRRTGLNMLGYSVSSATSAFIPLTQAAATTNTKAFTKGMVDTITNLVRKDGFAGKSDFLTRRVGSKPLMRNMIDKVSDNSMAMMDMVDRFSSQTIVRGKYYELLEKGIPEKEALKQADDWAGRVMTDRSKGQQPTMFSSKTLGPLLQFQVEVNNQLSFIFKDIPKTAKNKAQLMNQMTQVLVYSYLANEVYEKILGRRPAFDPAGVAQEAYRNFSNPDMGEKESTGKLLKGIAGQLPFTSTFTGGRYPVNSAIPSLNIEDYEQNRTTLGKEITKPIKYLLLPTGGGQINKTYQANKILNNEGVYTEKGDLQYPVENNTENLLKGLILGKSSFPETKEYYDKPFGQRKKLGSKQTAKYEEARQQGLGKEFYDLTILNRTENSKKDKLKAAQKEIEEIKNDSSLTDKEREEMINEILLGLDPQ